MIPVLYSKLETAFTSHGLGALKDAISCVVVEERNGEYELTMEYPVGGVHADEIEDRAVITAIPSPYRAAQPFRVYSIETPINGIMTIHARHLSYDLSGIPVEPFTAASCATALDGLVSHSAVTNPFSVSTDKLTTATYNQTVPRSFRSCLGGVEGSILDVFGGGEYEFDGFNVVLYNSRGSDNGVRIAYGKNLTDFNMERNLDSLITGVYPYWSSIDDEGSSLVELDDKIIHIYDAQNPGYLKEAGGDFLTEAYAKYLMIQNAFPFDNVLTLDLSDQFESQPTQAQLQAAADRYIKENKLGAPTVSIDCNFIDLGRTDEYAALAGLEECDLCDTVTVEFPAYGIQVKAKIVKVETDVLLEKYNEVSIGNARTTIADTIAGLELNSATKQELKAGSSQAADVINNTKGTFEWIDNDHDGKNEGFTIYESDGVAFLRCTAGGIGLSQDGGLTYTNAITKNGVTATNLLVQKAGVTVFEARHWDSSYASTGELNMTDYISGNRTVQLQSYRTIADNRVSTSLLLGSDTGSSGNSTYLLITAQSYDSSNDGTPVLGFNAFGVNNDGVTSSNIHLGIEGSGSDLWTNMYFRDGDGNMMFGIVNYQSIPRFYVWDSSLSNYRTLTLRRITINGTNYYIMAAT